MAVEEIHAKSILRKHKRIDSWFLSRYSMNLYRGCTHDCAYCDGRAEGYYVDGEFGRDVAVKVNAIEVLRRELDPRRKRKPMKGGFVMLGGGVGDSYQPLERRYELSRKTLDLLARRGLPVHVLTKSCLVERDLDLLQEIDGLRRAVVSFSLSTADDALGARFEPGAASPTERLETLGRLKRAGLGVGVFLMPVIPFVTDTDEQLDATLKAVRVHGGDFVVFGGMTLKDGRQKDHFDALLKEHHPELLDAYRTIYPGSKWGSPTRQYQDTIQRRFARAAARHGLPTRMPRRLWERIVDDNDRVVVLLDQIHYLLELDGHSSPYGFAAHALSRLDRPLRRIEDELGQLEGVGSATAPVIQEILQTGTARLYEELIRARSGATAAEPQAGP